VFWTDIISKEIPYMKSFLVALLIAFFALPAHALIYTGRTARHTYVIDLVDRFGRDVYGAYISVTELTLYSARIIVQGPGIPFQYGTVRVNPYVNYVSGRLIVRTAFGAALANTQVLPGDVVATPVSAREAQRIKNFDALHREAVTVLTR
jgi:hypothetical protein